MKLKQISRDEFLALGVEEINKIIKKKQIPKVAVFVIDGNFRMTMVQTGKQPSSDEFYKYYFHFILERTHKVIQLFFKYHLHALFLPIISEKLLERGNIYCAKALLPILKNIFTSAKWINLYNKLGLKVKIYGNPRLLKQTK